MGRKSAAALAAEAEAAAAADLAACKQYMRVDGDGDDALITTLMSAAKEYLRNAGIEEPEGGDCSLYTTAVHSLTLHYYDHRDAVGEEAAFPTGLRPIINQLKHISDGAL
ncbi:MAG: head-tail connector protein [Oscillospiraceae bacterium]|nr:head-tail connector protein [Oscillospiraceae bacterium]